MSVAPGTVLAGKYRVDYMLGEGGMGVVVAATDMQLERRVAIKFLLPDYAQHHEAAQRFLREARAAVKIQSEHVARVIDVGTMDGGSPYMVMEFLEGKDLAGVLEERTLLPVQEAVAYVLEACDAIAEAHSVGIVHRDLKPANVFLAQQPDGSVRVKVLDFGISKAMVTATTGINPSLTRTSSMMGSPLYMSPEQMKSAKKVDPRTDIWALGVILYELLSGKPPFYAESIPELSAMVLLEEPQSLSSMRSDIPPALEAAIKRALSKDPAGRFPTVADLAHALVPFGPHRTRQNVERAARVLKVSGVTVPMSEPPPPATSGTHATLPAPPVNPAKLSVARTSAAWTETGPAPKKGNSWVVPAALGAGLVGVGVVLFAVFGHGRTEGGGPPSGSVSAVSQPVAPNVPPIEKTPTEVVPVIAAPTPSAAASVMVEPATPTVEPAMAPAKPIATAKGAHAKPVAAKPKPEDQAKPAVVATPDPFSGFGSRK